MGKNSASKRNWGEDDDQFSKFDEYKDFDEYADLNGLDDFEDFGREGEIREFENYDGFSMYPLDSSFIRPEKIRKKGTFDIPENNQLNNKPKRSPKKKI